MIFEDVAEFLEESGRSKAAKELREWADQVIGRLALALAQVAVFEAALDEGDAA